MSPHACAFQNRDAALLPRAGDLGIVVVHGGGADHRVRAFDRIAPVFVYDANARSLQPVGHGVLGTVAAPHDVAAPPAQNARLLMEMPPMPTRQTLAPGFRISALCIVSSERKF